MKSLLAFMKKEYRESVRTGKLLILLLLFVLFGIMNPATAKLTPWLMEMCADTMSESGLTVASVSVDAMTSWTQFFKNIPMALIAYVLLFSDIFTKEYKSGTLLLVLTKGLARYKVVLAKTVLLLSGWTFGYWLCFAITYGYNAYFWDNEIVDHVITPAAFWWLFGVWVLCLIILFSSLLQNNVGVSLCTGGTVLFVYLFSLIPIIRECSPIMLIDTNSLLAGAEGMGAYAKAAAAAAALSFLCVAVSIPVINKKQL